MASKKKRSKAKAKAKAKAKPKRAAAKKPRLVERNTKRLDAPKEPIDEAITEPVADVSGMYRVAENLLRSQRGTDEDENKQFKDPSLIIEIEKQRALRHEKTIPIREEDIVSEDEPDED